MPFEGKSIHQRRYLGGYAPPIENLMCMLVSFFYPLFQSEGTPYSPFVREFAISFSAVIVVPFFEAYRSNSRFWPGFPLLMGLLYQCITAGATFPLFWALLILRGSKSSVNIEVKQGRAESVLAGIIIGYFVPCLGIHFWPSNTTIALWQIFPVYITIVAAIYRAFRTGQSANKPGTRVVCGTYALLFCLSAINHLGVMAAYEFDLKRGMNNWMPPIQLPDPQKGHTALHAIVHLLQWDSVFVFGSTLLASLWFVDNLFQGIVLLLWSTVASVLFGPGAAFSGIFLWRERRIHNKRNKQLAAIKARKN